MSSAATHNRLTELRLVAFDIDGVFTTTLPLDEAAKGYATAGSRSGDSVKVLLRP